MAPGRLLDDDESSFDLVSRHKRLRRDVMSNEEVQVKNDAVDEEEEAVTKGGEAVASASTVPPHPLGLRPSGNAYTATRDIKAFTGHFARLPDELLLQLLEVLDPVDLVKLGASCKALHAFCSSEDLWKTLFIEHPPSKSFSWRGTWRSTYLELPAEREAVVQYTDLYSDALYLPWHRARVSLQPFAQDIPVRNQITRLSNLTPDDFNANWASKPFILTEPVREWPLFKDWSWEHLSSKYNDTLFRAEAVDWPYSTYESYMRNSVDESPLYLFDCRFAEKMKLNLGDASTTDPSNPISSSAYTPPLCFSPDLFTTLGLHRPDHRWLIIGPSRSGSTFHADPNGTSAWNAVIRGSKYWLMFPPVADPSANPMPGLHISPDGSHITAPLSIAEYLLTFHAEARRHPGCVEAICKEGEVLHVPSGWYHMVLNLEDGIALTQNFVPKAHLGRVLGFLRDKRDQVSGFGREDVDAGVKGVEEGKEFELFVEKLREEGYGGEVEKALEEMRREDERRGRPSKWEILTGKARKEDVGDGNGAECGFSFGFGFEDDEDQEVEEV